ncbi:MAG: insulinase family protein, partial [Proteobacteria bacterium]|nr:insulinase family protein [Burkholderiales bacterium]
MPLLRPSPSRHLLLTALLMLATPFAALFTSTSPVRAQGTLSTPALPPGVTRGPSVEGISEYRLANGLRVLLFPDASSATFMANITYLVGSRHESYGERGMAHLLEHLLFRRSANHPNISKELSERGAWSNGTTWNDRTNYFGTFSASEDNLRWVIAMESDRMVNAAITRGELDPEMSVVRNEFEQGENSPVRVLVQRVTSSAYLWHNYGNSTIGARSDIENVPIDRLQAFYRTYYQPDNAVLLLAGQFDEPLALQLVAKHFGAIAAPKRALPLTYTVEPTQDGERLVTLRRTGDVQAVVASYHIPPASHADAAALDVLTDVLRTPPAGRLFRALVDTKRAVSVFGFDQQQREASSALYGAQLSLAQPIDAARDALTGTLENLAKDPVTEAEVERVRVALLRQYDQVLANPQALGRTMSEWIAIGDWRLFFLHRDRLRKVSADDVNRVAQTYFKPANRTLGVFIPDAKPDRAEIPSAPNLAELLRDFKGDTALAAGETFDPSPQNIEQRTLRRKLPAGLDLVLLPRRTRGETVNFQLTLRFGDEKSVFGRGTEAGFTGSMLMRGTRKLDRQQIQDEFNRLRAQVGIGGGPTAVTVSGQTVRSELPAVLTLVAQVLREPAFPQRDLDELRAEAIAGIDRQRQDPSSLGALAFNRHFNTHPYGDVRHYGSLDEQLAETRAVTLDGVRSFHRDFYGASRGEFAAVGDFDEATITELMGRLFGDWQSPARYERIPSVYAEVAPSRIVLETPDRANAYFRIGMNLPLRVDDPDYPALLLGEQLLGGGFLSSRLAQRVRRDEGLSYSVWAQIAAGSLDRSGAFQAGAIFAPENAARLERVVREELERALSGGFTDEEVASAKTGYLQSVRVARSADSRLAAALAGNQFLGRTYAFQGKLDAQVAATTPAQIVDALRRRLDFSKLTTVLAGDFAAASKRPE